MIKDMKPKLFEVGKIKIGESGAEKKAASGGKWFAPEKLDHFRIVQNIKDENGNYTLVDPIMQELGEKPKELDIVLIADDIDLIFQTRYAYYIGKNDCICSGDGETALRKLKSGKVETVDCSDQCKFRQEKKCKIEGTLSCLLAKANSIGGCYKFRTHGFYSVQAMLSSLFFIKQLTGGVLAWLPLKLKINEGYKRLEDQKKTIKFWYVSALYQGNAKQIINEALQIREDQIKRQIDMRKLEEQAKRLMLTSDNDENIVDEFYPDNSGDSNPFDKDGGKVVTLDDKLNDNSGETELEGDLVTVSVDDVDETTIEGKTKATFRWIRAERI